MAKTLTLLGTSVTTEEAGNNRFEQQLTFKNDAVCEDNKNIAGTVTVEQHASKNGHKSNSTAHIRLKDSTGLVVGKTKKKFEPGNIPVELRLSTLSGSAAEVSEGDGILHWIVDEAQFATGTIEVEVKGTTDTAGMHVLSANPIEATGYKDQIGQSGSYMWTLPFTVSEA